MLAYIGSQGLVYVKRDLFKLMTGSHWDYGNVRRWVYYPLDLGTGYSLKRDQR